MPSKYRLLSLLASLLLVAQSYAASVVNLTCEYKRDPLGIDETSPRLSWQIESQEHAVQQTAYRILVSTTPEGIKSRQADLWDSGKVESNQSLHLRYAGLPLSSRQTCYWSVQFWDQNNRKSEWSTIGSWEIGLPSQSDWDGANWIQMEGDNRSSPLTKRSLKTKFINEAKEVQSYPSPLFRKTFTVRPGIKRARAYLCGLGYSEMQINGIPCSDAVLDPANVTYDRRALYVTHDITAALHPGENVATVQLGSGFYGQNHAFNAPGLNYGRPGLIAKILVDYADGSTQTINSDSSWKASSGPILYDNVYGGESYDARLEMDGWQLPGFDDSSWSHATRCEALAPKLQAQMIDPIRRIKSLAPVSIIRGHDGKWIFDLGQNIAGWAKIRVQEPAGTQLTLRYSEILTDDRRELDMITTGVHATGLEQMDIYICKGDGIETWEPRFTYHGFRYIEIEGLSSPPDSDTLQGVFVRTAVARRGYFLSSDEVLNRIYDASMWTIEDNLHSILEDCPHREKCAWLGDTHAVGETAIFNYDMAQFWTKFADDIETNLGRGGVTYWGQKATPGIPTNVATGRRVCQEARPDWGSAYILLPWYQYLYYGDTDVFTRHYPHLKRWIQYVESLTENGIVIRGYGDWCPPGGNKHMECPVELSSTAFYYGTLRVMQRFAEYLGKQDDVEQFKELARRTKDAFNKTYFDESIGGYGSQTANAISLRFELFPERQRERVSNSLVHDVTANHLGHVAVGIHGGRPIYSLLSESGSSDAAIAALKKPTWPSYSYALSQGLTTWPEIFDEFPRGRSTSGRSLNHPMQSGFAAWFHESLGGIRPGAPGFKVVHLKPYGFDQLDWVKTSHDSPYGTIKSEWSKNGERFQWEVSIPANTTARISIPSKAADLITMGGNALLECSDVKLEGICDGYATFTLDSGSYSIDSELP
ncbi:family 78 glycoside hydrolase catalytic domain [Pelagicoccus sp. NFK12]|uniref:alpha-L-rhamnosidase n=1 Tax=Pelagicoccus enzymogenes TaxID=2773457 RepID=A0A927FD69_9BACT|nr:MULTISPECIES: family 78 glycoside hydrolase catalytic domain [Pelagicoccus]MBD5781611.1 family 78 glycoside hydrolase catalytic domain [Pelagicoccus enzymogenes]MDQ8181131.1 family 78 glycoside hydrolase catalytic domain [Pelagicoccus sp. SDUM812005]